MGVMEKLQLQKEFQFPFISNLNRNNLPQLITFMYCNFFI